jgi:hypothetical protein
MVLGYVPGHYLVHIIVGVLFLAFERFCYNPLRTPFSSKLQPGAGSRNISPILVATKINSAFTGDDDDGADSSIQTARHVTVVYLAASVPSTAFLPEL